MERNYWTKVLDSRLNRRRALAATGATATAAAFLAACGGGSSDTAEPEGEGALTRPVDSSKQAKRGGTVNDRATGDPNTLDISAAINPLNPPARLAYNTLVRIKPGILEQTDNSLMPDIAESWETAPDGLTITLKLRQNVKFHDKPPVNGRTLDMDDVLFSWKRFTEKSPNRTGLHNTPTSPNAPVLSLTAADSRTIVIKLATPLVYALDLFASNTASHSGSVLILPKETDSTFQIGTDMIGAGPYSMQKYETSVGFTMKRHPGYYDQDWGYLDEIYFPIIVDPNNALAQFKKGELLTYGVGPQDILAVKKEQPQLLLFESDYSVVGTAFTFGLLPEGKSPFLDERVRQAASMAWDRDLFIDTFRNVEAFRKEGLPVNTRWNSALGATWDGWWLDPKSKEFGPNAKYYTHDIAEAKKLLSAAGFPNGIPDIRSHHITTNELGDLPRNADVVDGFMAEAGLVSKIDPIIYATEYIPQYRDGQGQYEGWTYHTNAGGTGIGPVGLMSNEYWPKGGSAFKGFSASGKNDKSGDPALNTLIEKARIEQDTEKRRNLVYDIQRHIAGKMWGLILPGGSTGFDMAWPALQNFRVFRAPQVWRHYKWWIDQEKAPFKTA